MTFLAKHICRHVAPWGGGRFFDFLKWSVQRPERCVFAWDSTHAFLMVPLVEVKPALRRSCTAIFVVTLMLVVNTVEAQSQAPTVSTQKELTTHQVVASQSDPLISESWQKKPDRLKLPILDRYSFSGQSQPNIILIYIDDLSYSDLGCYAGEHGSDFIETPNIDRFAQRSTRFTNAYAAAPLCSPSRAALLTGKTPARLNFEFVTKWEKDRKEANDPDWSAQFRNMPLVPPPYTLNLPLEQKTIAEVLKGAGYHTAIAGKWHLSAHSGVYNGWSAEYGPAKQGFDWTSNVFGAWSKNSALARQRAVAGEYAPDSLTDQAIAYISQKHHKPFFLYLSHYYVHTPIDADLKWLVAKYKNKAALRNDNISDKQIRYAAFVETMDHYVGEFLKAVERQGLFENSIVIFTSDNGGMPEFSSNRPFRGSKWNLYEGGIRIPMLISMPQSKVPSVSNEPISQMDFLPTFYRMATGKAYSDSAIDGYDISGLLDGSKWRRKADRSMIWHFPYYHPEGKAYDTAWAVIGRQDWAVSKTRPQSAIRKGDYKLIYYHETGDIELYNLATDLGEQNDLSKLQKGKAKELRTGLLTYLQKVKARFPQRR